MKKIMSLVFAVVLAFFAIVTAFASDTIYIALDGDYIEFDVKPQIINGRTMVPVRAIFEKMGASVKWNDNTRSAICSKGETIVKMTVDSKNMYINDQVIKMDVAPAEINGRTLAPVRYVAQAFGADVQWSQKNDTVVICSEGVYAYADYPDIPDLGRCYDIPLLDETNENGFKLLSYSYSDMTYDEYYNNLYDKSVMILGEYTEQVTEGEDGSVLIGYTKPEETAPRYFVSASYDEYGTMVFVVKIPVKESEEKNPSASKGLSADGNYYRTPKGKKYHLDPECGGKNSYKTTDISGLSPCSKCAK